MMRVDVIGSRGGIGRAVCELLWAQGDNANAINHEPPDACVCCNGSHTTPIANNLHTTLDALANHEYRIVITMSGAGIGGPPHTDLGPDYVASKAGIVAATEWYAVKYPERQFFCVAPGDTTTKMSDWKGVDPRIPAAFIVKLLSGKYGHLSGCLLAAQRDDLDTMKRMVLRRVES